MNVWWASAAAQEKRITGQFGFGMVYIFARMMTIGKMRDGTTGQGRTPNVPDGRSMAALETSPAAAPLKRRLVIASPPEAEPKPVPGFDPTCCFAPDHLAWSPDSKRLLVSL